MKRRLVPVMILFVLSGAGGKPVSFALDCNRNGVEDEIEVARPGVAFREGTSIDTGRALETVAVGDVERDGDLDLVVPSLFDPDILSDPHVLVLGNDGQGNFTPRGEVTFLSRLKSILLQDLDADGLPELEAAPGLDCDGNGSLDACDLQPRFALGQEEYDAGEYPWDVATGDLDGDGNLDLAVAEYRGGDLGILANRGNGTYAPARKVRLGTSLTHAATADLDADGDLDMAAAGHDGGSCFSGVWVIVNEGKWSFRIHASHDLGFWVHSLNAVDVDRRGSPDLVVGMQDRRSAGKILLLRGLGDATFALPELIDGRGVNVVVADLDGDGDADVASDRGALLLNRGEGTFARGPDLPATGIGIEGGDLDGDADLDLALDARPSAGLHLLLDACEATPFHRGDADGDGRLDITDPLRLLEHLFRGGKALECQEAADAQDDGRVNIADPVYILHYLFQGGAAPAFPGPPSEPCGADPDPPGAAGDLECESYAGC